MRCSLPIRSGQVGDVDSGDDWADPAGAFPQGEGHQGDRAGPEGVPEHGPQGAAVGGDIVRIRTLGSASTEAGPVGGGPRRPAGRQCDEARPRAAHPDPPLRRTAWAGLRGRLRCGAALRQAMAKERGQSTAAAYVPLSFAPGEAYQFDWSHEVVLLNGVTVMVKAAHVRLCHSRMLFVRVYPRETQEMVFDAHDRAFALFKGACGRGIYDNMKTAVETIFVGKQRLYNRRFLQMCSHYLVEPIACTPASGWEKGQVENQVGLVRERFFTPRLRFKNLDELNAWLLDKCIAYAKAHRHEELIDQTIWEVFEAERPKLVAYAGRFDGFHAVPASVSKTCLVRFDNNKYSVTASAVGRPVEVHAYADHFVIRQDGRIVAEHPRSFGRGETVYDPWHYVPVLARKPGALRNGAPFKDWVLPAAMERVRRKLAGVDDGNRQMVDILNAVLTDGLPAVEAACAEALGHGVHSADVVLNILARQREPPPAANILTPAALTLRHAPIADCARYDNLRRTM